MKLSIIGTGQMGQALARAFVSGEAVHPHDLLVFDVDEQKASRCAMELGAQTADSLEQACSDTAVILLAVKPPVVASVLQSLHPLLSSQLVVSIAAGITLDQLRKGVPESVALARVMPNTPAQVGCGVSAVCFDGTKPEQEQWVETLFMACGRVFHVTENQMDAVTALSGSGPAYIYLVIEALADGAVREGLTRDIALDMAAMTVCGAARMVLETKQHPAVLKDAVCSPGGTTIEAISALEKSGLRSALIQAVSEAAGKSRQLGRAGNHEA